MSTVWKELHSNYQVQDWIEKPSLFAESVIPFFPKGARVLELGAGHGQDSIFLAKQGYHVTSTDIETTSLEKNISKQPDLKITIMPVDLKKALPYPDHSFDVVYAHLSLHYFDLKTTQSIIKEIERILKPGGVFAFLANSTNDPEYGTGTFLEEDFFLIDKITKRYFSIETARKLTQNFHADLIDDLGQTYKDKAKGVHHLIRFVGRKVS